MKKNTFVTIIVLILLAIGAYFLIFNGPSTPELPSDDEATTTPIDRSGATSTDDEATTTDTEETADESQDSGVTTIGTSVEGRAIEAYHFGDGETHLLFVSGIHGGYEWNTSLLAYDLINYFEGNSDVIPDSLSVTVIPALNPDGLAAVTGTAGSFTASDVDATQEEQVAARFNANDVDLNRNFDCDWQSESMWQSRTVDGGEAPFSEPESQAIRDYLQANTPDAAVVYYSAAGAVYSSNCEGDVMSATNDLMNTYATASGYPAEGLFDAYAINGDMVNWMAKQGIPAISVLLSTHEAVEFDMNRSGVEAVLEAYAQ